MTILLTLFSILQSISISLGMGSSTLAIINFFTAIADGKIDDSERKMMGVVYIVLRVAMVLILISSAAVIFLSGDQSGSLLKLTTFEYAILLPLAMLYINAILMTLHLMPTTFGPSIQAGSWYTLGTLVALEAIGLTNFTFVQFILAYITWLVLATAIVNGIMAWLKAHRHGLIKK